MDREILKYLAKLFRPSESEERANLLEMEDSRSDTELQNRKRTKVLNSINRIDSKSTVNTDMLEEPVEPPKLNRYWIELTLMSFSSVQNFEKALEDDKIVLISQGANPVENQWANRSPISEFFNQMVLSSSLTTMKEFAESSLCINDGYHRVRYDAERNARPYSYNHDIFFPRNSMDSLNLPNMLPHLEQANGRASGILSKPSLQELGISTREIDEDSYRRAQAERIREIRRRAALDRQNLGFRRIIDERDESEIDEMLSNNPNTEIINTDRGNRIAKLLVKPQKKGDLTECIICKDELSKKDAGCAVLECLHWFHFDCFSAWAGVNPICPCCKKQVIVVRVTTEPEEVKTDEEEMVYTSRVSSYRNTPQRINARASVSKDVTSEMNEVPQSPGMMEVPVCTAPDTHPRSNDISVILMPSEDCKLDTSILKHLALVDDLQNQTHIVNGTTEQIVGLEPAIENLMIEQKLPDDTTDSTINSSNQGLFFHNPGLPQENMNNLADPKPISDEVLDMPVSMIKPSASNNQPSK
jgi:Ring finger domain